MRMSRIGIVFIVLMLSLSLPVMHVSAEGDTEITVVVVGDGNVTGYINGTANNGSVYYYIDGIEVSGEFADVWDAIISAKEKASDAHDLASSAYCLANTAWVIAKDNEGRIAAIETNLSNLEVMIWMLRDEVIAFEEDYIVFKNGTRANFTMVNSRIDTANDRIDDLYLLLNEKEEQLYQYAHIQTVMIAGLVVVSACLVWQHINKERIIGKIKPLKEYGRSLLSKYKQPKTTKKLKPLKKYGKPLIARAKELFGRS